MRGLRVRVGTTYVRSEQNVGIERRTSVCCVLFGVTIVYVASVIIHLAAASSVAMATVGHVT